MSYTKQNFQSGDKLYASQLNAMDDQIALNESRIDGLSIDYPDLTNKPQINGVTLTGNKTASDLGLLSGEGVADAVDDWLDENITNPDSPPLDRSLTSSSAAAPADMVGDLKADLSDVKITTKQKASAIYHTVEDQLVISVDDGADDQFVRDLIVEITPVQSGSGDPSPSNIRPITGFTEANITRTGINIWDEQWENGYWDVTTGQPVSNSSYIRCKHFIRVTPNTKYRLVVGGSVYTHQTLYFDENKNILSYGSVANNTVFTTPANCYWLKFYLNKNYGNTYNNDVSINYPYTDTKYHHNPDAFAPVSWSSLAGTVYGGYLNVITGILTVTDANIASYNGETLPGAWISDRDVYSSGTVPTTGAQVVYKLATPATYQLDAISISTILGKNVIIADTGKVLFIAYPADTDMYLQAMNNSLEAGIAANGANIQNLNNGLYNSDSCYNIFTNLQAGYYNGDGTIHPASSSYLEEYADLVPATIGMKFALNLQFTESTTMWIKYLKCDENRTPLGVISVDTTTSAKSISKLFEIDDTECKYIGVFFRTYGRLLSANLSTIRTGDIYVNKQNLFSITKSKRGYIDDSTGAINANFTNGNRVSEYIPVVAESKYTILFAFDGKSNVTPGLRYCFYDSQKSKVGNPITVTISADRRYKKFEEAVFLTAPNGAAYICIAYTLHDSGRISFYTGHCYATYNLSNADMAYLTNRSDYPSYMAPLHMVQAIGHRGCSFGPENTLPAFVIAKQRGYDRSECDIALTSDGVPVLLHDASINRTARNNDGTTISETVNIIDITYEQALEYDFGIRTGNEFAGTRIPTFTEFIALCKKIALKPDIELKASTLTESDVENLVSIVEQYGMLDKVRWLSSYSSRLEWVLNYDSHANVGYLISIVTDEAISIAQSLKTSDNIVHLGAEVGNDVSFQKAVDAKIPLEAGPLNTKELIMAIHPYISGVTSDGYVAWQVLSETYFDQYPY